MDKITANTVYTSYQSIIDPNHPSLSEDIENDNYPLPEFTIEILRKLFLEAICALQKVPMLVELEGPAVIVGDIHGNIRDLIRIIRANGNPSNKKYIFLGDYVDRGDFSLEVITLLIALHILFPNNITLLRGNHECLDVSNFYGFRKEIEDRFNNLDLYYMAISVFDNLSLAAIIEGYLCIHGGLCKNFQKLSDISNLTKPLNLETTPQNICDLVEGILWSDPFNSQILYANSQRGRGCLFGELAAAQFCKKNNIKGIIRGHSMAPLGIKKEMGGMVITVFSTGYYVPNQFPNKPGYLTVKDGKTYPFSLNAIPQMKRETAVFVKMSNTYSLKGRLSGLQIGPGSKNVFYSSPRKGIFLSKGLSNSLLSLHTEKSSQNLVVKRKPRIALAKLRSSSDESFPEKIGDVKLPSLKGL